MINHQKKKSLGQNFFNNQHLAEKIVSLVKENIDSECLLEVGPGSGAFTQYLYHRYRLILVEKDSQLTSFLRQEFPQATVINKDILTIDVESILSEIKCNNTGLFGSLPYNISKNIIFRFTEEFLNIKTAVVIIQKEVAEKFNTPNNKIGHLIRFHAEPQILIRTIKPNNFTPAPKVNSSLIMFKRTATPAGMEYSQYQKLITQLFSKPRKKISNNLPQIKQIKQLKKYANLRPSELTQEDTYKIYHALYDAK